MDNNQLHDPSVEGTKGLSGLKGVGATARETLPSAPLISRRQRNIAAQASDKYSGSSKEFIGVKGLGDSKLDKDISLRSDIENISDFRGREQSGFEQIGAGIAKAGVLAGTTFVNSTAGLIAGAITAAGAAASGKGFDESMSKFWDNDVTKSMLAINDLSEELMPNYYSDEEREGPWYDHVFTANFVGDKVLKNMGFTVGSIAAGALTGGLINPIAAKAGTKAGAFLARSLSTAVSAAGEATFEAANGTKEFMEAQVGLADQKFASSSKEIMDRYDLMMIDLDALPDSMINIPGVELPVSKKEYTARALQLMRLEELQSLNETRNKEILAATNERIKMGNTIAGLNMAILGASNNIQFGRVLSGGFENAKKIANHRIKNKLTGEFITDSKTVAKAMKEGAAEFVGKGGFKKAVAKNMLANGMSEGTEEASQNLASNTSQTTAAARVNKFLGYKFNPLEEEELDNHLNAFTHSLNKEFGSASSAGWEEFALGFASGLIGVPIIKRKSDGGIKGEWVGGAKEAYQEAMDYRTSDEQLIAMNQMILSQDFVERYLNMIRRNSIQNEMDNALENDDMLEYKNSEFALLINDAVMFRNIDEQDTYLLFIRSFESLTDDDIESIRSQGIDQSTGTSIYAGKTNDDVKKDITLKALNIENQFKDVIKSYELLSALHGDVLSKDAIEELVYLKSMALNSGERATQISETLSEKLKPVAAEIGRYDENATEEELNDRNELSESINNLINNDLTGFHRLFKDDKSGEDAKSLINNMVQYIQAKNPSLDLTGIELDAYDLNRLVDQQNLYLKQYNDIVKNKRSAIKFENAVVKEKSAINNEEVSNKAKQIEDKFINAGSIKEIRDVDNEYANDKALENIDMIKVMSNPVYKEYIKVQEALNFIKDQLGDEAYTKIQGKLEDANSLDELLDKDGMIYHNLPLAESDLVDFAIDAYDKSKKAATTVIGTGDDAISLGAGVSIEINETKAPVVQTSTPVAEGKVSTDTKLEESRRIAEINLKISNNMDNTDPKSELPDNLVKGKSKLYYSPVIPKFWKGSSQSWSEGLISDLKMRDRLTPEDESGINRIYNYLLIKDAFNDISSKVKPGDIVFMAKDNTYSGDDMMMVTVKDGAVTIVGSFPVNPTAIDNHVGLQGFMDRAKSKSNTFGDFEVYTGESLTVSQIMNGKIVKSDNLRKPSEVKNNEKPVYIVIGPYNEPILSDNSIDIKKVDGIKDNTSGLTYLVHKKDDGTYGVNMMITTHFNDREMDYDPENNPYHKGILQSIEAISSVTSDLDLLNEIRQLDNFINTEGLHCDYIDEKGKVTILLSKPIKGTKDRYRVYIKLGEDQEKNKLAVLKGLQDINLPMKVDKSKISDSNYIKYITNSGVVKTNVVDNKMQGGWFITDYKGENGLNLTPTRPTPDSDKKISSTSSEKESIGKQLPVLYNGVNLTIDPVNNKVYKDGVLYNVGNNIELIKDISSYLNRKGDSRVNGNFFLTRSNKILNTRTNSYEIGEISEKIKKDIIDSFNGTRIVSPSIKTVSSVNTEIEFSKDTSMDSRTKFSVNNEVLLFENFKSSATYKINGTKITEYDGHSVYIGKMASYKGEGSKKVINGEIDIITYFIIFDNGIGAQIINDNDGSMSESMVLSKAESIINESIKLKTLDKYLNKTPKNIKSATGIESKPTPVKEAVKPSTKKSSTSSNIYLPSDEDIKNSLVLFELTDDGPVPINKKEPVIIESNKKLENTIVKSAKLRLAEKGLLEKIVKLEKAINENPAKIRLLTSQLKDLKEDLDRVVYIKDRDEAARKRKLLELKLYQVGEDIAYLQLEASTLNKSIIDLLNFIQLTTEKELKLQLPETTKLESSGKLERPTLTDALKKAKKGTSMVNKLARGGRSKPIVSNEKFLVTEKPVLLDNNNLDNTDNVTTFTEFSKLSESNLQSLIAKGFTAEDFNKLTPEEKDNAVKCL